jgi:hypothetical protein
MSKIIDVVRTKYWAVATSGLSSDHAGVRSVGYAAGDDYDPKCRLDLCRAPLP